MLDLALWFLSDVAEGIATRERAFDGCVAAGTSLPERARFEQEYPVAVGVRG